MAEDLTQPLQTAVAEGAVRVHDDVPDFSGVARGAADHFVVEDDSAADAGAHVHEDEAARAAGAAGPGFGDGGAGDVLVHERRETGGFGQGVPQPHTVPARQQRRVHDGPLVEVDGSRSGNAESGDPVRIHAGVADELLDFVGDGGNDRRGGRCRVAW